MPLSRLYQQVLLEHNRHPRNHGPLAGATHSARGQDALCGDDIRVDLKVDRNGRIRAASFDGIACAVTTASASMLTEWLVGRSLAEFEAGRRRFVTLLGNPEGPEVPELGELNHLRAVAAFPARVRNALLPWNTAARALGLE